MSDTGRRQRPPFAMIPEALLDAAVSDRAVRLYALLDRYTGANERAWPSRATIAARLGCSEDSVDRAVRDLEAAGYLTVERRAAAGAGNVYTLRDRPRRPSTGSRTRAVTATGPGSRTGADPVAAPVRHKGETGTREPQTPPPDGGRAPDSPRTTGTNPRALGTNPRASRPTPPVPGDDLVAAARQRADIDAARLRGDLCPEPGCDGGWVAQQIGDDDVVVDRCDTCDGSGVRLTA